MRNVREVVEAARGKPILYFPARHDHWLVQTGDGWAAHVAGAIGVSTDAQASWWGGRGVGTVPHGLIAAYGGDTVLAARKFADRFAERDERDRARRLRQRLGRHRARGRRRARRPTCGACGWTPRDTLADARCGSVMGDVRAHRRRARARAQGPRRARRRRPPATCGSSSPAASRATASATFEAEGVPVDAYGVGSSLIRGANDFTADVVRSTGGRARRSGASSGRTRAWRSSPSRRSASRTSGPRARPSRCRGCGS